MDKKLILNAKLNIATNVAEFWIWITKICNKLHGAVLKKSRKAVLREMDILREMLNENYPESYKNEIKEVLKTETEL